MIKSVCEFIDIGLDSYECIKCGIIVQSIDGPPATLCSGIDLNDLNDIETDIFCSQSQLDKRYSICSECEFFINNSCVKCGCVVVRNAQFKNKLLFKDQTCPVGKWQTES